MNNYEMNKMLLHLSLIDLRSRAQWWLGGGLLLVFWSPFLMVDIQLFVLFIPMMISGTMILIKGSFLWSDYVQLNERYKFFVSQDVRKEWIEALKPKPFAGPRPMGGPVQVHEM